MERWRYGFCNGVIGEIYYFYGYDFYDWWDYGVFFDGESGGMQ